jgi:hypothetical protein
MADDPTPTYETRQGDPGATYIHHDHDGTRIELKADSHGVVHPDSDAEVRAADAFGLPPVASKAENAAATTAEGS